MKEFTTAVKRHIEEAPETDTNEPTKRTGPYVEFKMDDRVMKAYRPNEAQLTFIMAAMGRGQSTQERYGNIVNIMMESLDSEDKDYFESRLLTGDPKQTLSIEEDIQPIFAYLTEEWFREEPEAGSEAGGSGE